jgi:hypothetical protein
MMLFVLFHMINYIKIEVFQNYQENVTHSELALRMVLEPGYQTVFLILNSALVVLLLKILEKNTNTLVKTLNRTMEKPADYELHMFIYGYNIYLFL